MDNIFKTMENHIFHITAINLAIVAVLIIFLLAISRKLKSITKGYKSLSKISDKKSIEQLVYDAVNISNDAIEENIYLKKRVEDLERNMKYCVKRVGVVRYNAFRDVGSDLSFSVALLDDTSSGVVISGIYSRETSTTYAKKIINGQSKHVLSKEELQAITEAKTIV